MSVFGPAPVYPFQWSGYPRISCFGVAPLYPFQLSGTHSFVLVARLAASDAVVRAA